MRWLVQAGAAWRLLPHDLPPWPAVYQQAQRWERARVFERLVDDLRGLLRTAEGRDPEPSAVIFDSRTLQSTPTSGAAAGYDGAKGRKVHWAVDTIGHWVTLLVTAAHEQDRVQVGELAADVQEVTGGTVQLAYGDQGYTGADPAAAAPAVNWRIIRGTFLAIK